MRNKYVRSESRARIILSRERDIEKKLDEKERITLELEEYMKQYAALTGETKVISPEVRRRMRRRKARLVAILVAFAAIAGVVVYYLLAR
ncbi:MAG: hypothetical protein IKV20_05525 [Clostridia bacterium]|nr:hypothetical protein [Clostridia bacterium]